MGSRLRTVADAGLRAVPCQTVLLLFLVCAWAANADQDEPVHHIVGVGWTGNKATKNHVIAREVRAAVGTRLDDLVLQQDVQRLQNLDIFSSVRVETTVRGDSAYVLYRLRELPPVVPYISYDVTDQDGWSFGPAVKSVNLMGQDIFVAGYALFGGRTSYLLDLTHPWMLGDHVSLDLDASRIVRQNDFDGFEETSSEFTPRIGTWIGDHGRASVAVSWLRFDADLDGRTLSASNTDDLLRLGASVGYDSRDDWSNPTRGWWAETELWKTGTPLGGDGDFWTLGLDGRRFQPVAPGHTIVAAGLLTMQSGRVGRDLPGYMDFHLGGANSLRGYTIDDLGHTLFGAHQLLTTLEYRIPLIEPTEITLFGMSADLGLGGTLFIDGGLAWTGRDEFDMDRARFGTGGGLRLLLPAVDMTRLEVGYGRQGWSFHFASFSKMRAQRLRLR